MLPMHDEAYRSDDDLSGVGHHLKPTVMVVTGEVRQGKTTFLQTLLQPLARQNFSVGGFLALGVHENEERVGFDLLDIATGQTTPLCTIRPLPGALQTGRFSFFEMGMETGQALLTPEINLQHDLIFIDELGPMELNDKGWSSSVENLIRHTTTPQVWVVRRTLVEKMRCKWDIGQTFIIDIGTDTAEAAVEVLCDMVEAFRGKKS
jgi:nucleoside-triphosphatase THEP1